MTTDSRWSYVDKWRGESSSIGSTQYTVLRVGIGNRRITDSLPSLPIKIAPFPQHLLRQSDVAGNRLLLYIPTTQAHSSCKMTHNLSFFYYVFPTSTNYFSGMLLPPCACTIGKAWKLHFHITGVHLCFCVLHVFYSNHDYCNVDWFVKLLYLEMLYGPIIKRQQSDTIKFCRPVTPIVGMHIVLLASHGRNPIDDYNVW